MCEFAMMEKHKVVVGPRRCLGRCVISDVNSLSIERSSRPPCSTSPLADALETGSIIDSYWPIVNVLAMGSNAKIAAPIIKAISVLVVRFSRIFVGQPKNNAVHPNTLLFPSVPIKPSCLARCVKSFSSLVGKACAPVSFGDLLVNTVNDSEEATGEGYGNTLLPLNDAETVFLPSARTRSSMSVNESKRNSLDDAKSFVVSIWNGRFLAASALAESVRYIVFGCHGRSFQRLGFGGGANPRHPEFYYDKVAICT